MAMRVGERIGDYEILSVLGAGGMGRVYRVHSLISERIEAIKVLLPDLAAEPALAERFKNEIRTLAALDHPHIAQFRTAFEFSNQLVMVMEFVEGESLDRIAARQTIPLVQVLSYADQLLGALAYAHARGTIHRDIKPANVVVTPEGQLKLLDFGVAKRFEGHDLTEPGTTVGSLQYMSPEQVRGQAVDARSDIYSTGVLLYELTTGQKPFQADSTCALIEKKLNESPQPPRTLNPNVSESLNEIILMSLASDPAKRFQKAEALRSALNRLHPQQPRVGASAASAITAQMPARSAGAAPSAQASARKGERGLWMASGATAAAILLITALAFAPRWLRAQAHNKPAVMPSTEVLPEGSPATEKSPVREARQIIGDQSRRPESDLVPAEKQPVPEQPLTAPHPTEIDAISKARNQRAVPPKVGGAPEPGSPATGDTAVEQGFRSEDAINALRERRVQLGSRAAAAKESVERMRAELAAGGLGLRSDITASLSRLEAYLDGVDGAIGRSDPATGDRKADQAETELNRLENFLGR